MEALTTHGGVSTRKNEAIMKRFFLFLLIGWGLISSGCYRCSGTVWEDTKTIGRRLHRKAQLLWRKDVDSRMVESKEDFKTPEGEEYIPYEDHDITTLETEFVIPAAKPPEHMQGNLSLDIAQFRPPEGALSSLFEMLHFDTDSDKLGSLECEIVAKIANYMKSHPDLYLFVEGHTDQRASKTYNLALGTRRANSVRAALVQQGAHPDHVFTISYGKELPLDPGQNPAAWAKNRRAMFKLFNASHKDLP